MMHMIVSAIVHGVIYRAIWGLERHEGTHGVVAIAIAVIGAMFIGHLVMRMFRPRRRRYARYANRSRRDDGYDSRPRNDRNNRNDHRDDDGASP